MFTLASGFIRYMLQKDEYYVLILGLDNAGKTTLLEQTKTQFNKNYRMMNPARITATVGLNIGEIELSGVKLNFWDLGGQDELQSLWDKYYAESHAVIYVIDSSDEKRLRESYEAFDKMIRSDALKGVPLLIMCNKQDISGSLSVPDIKTVFNESVEFIGHRDCSVIPASALNGDGVHRGIDWVVEKCKANSAKRLPLQRDIT